ncbi:MAG: Gfo/Idh/MocA family oxidoreductase [Planctomycetes bacterium]|nr:Gfo/Idh/MocA family oxidoreductase [Planctomycetota bacterium]
MSPHDRREFLVHGASAAAAFALSPELLAKAALPQTKVPIDVAVIGCGRQGRAILGELAKIEGVKVAAVVDVLDSRLKSGQRRVQGAEGYASTKELLEKAKSVSAVFVATPSHTHRDVALECLAAGKHVYVESPLATTLDDTRAIVQAARKSGKVAVCGMYGRSNPIYQLARSFFKSGAIRDTATMRAQYHKKNTWRTPGANPEEEAALNWPLDPKVSLGLVGEYGTQQFDVVHWFLGAYPTSVRGFGSIQLHKDGRAVHDTVLCELTFPGDRRLVYDASLANSFESQYELFCGSMGSIKLAWNAGWMFKEADSPTQGWEVYANRQQFHDEQGITLIADATKLAAQGKLKEGVGLPNPPLYYPLADFLKSVTENAPVVCSVDEGHRAAAVAILAHQALVKGETLAIDDAAFKTE